MTYSQAKKENIQPMSSLASISGMHDSKVHCIMELGEKIRELCLFFFIIIKFIEVTLVNTIT